MEQCHSSCLSPVMLAIVERLIMKKFRNKTFSDAILDDGLLSFLPF